MKYLYGFVKVPAFDFRLTKIDRGFGTCVSRIVEAFLPHGWCFKATTWGPSWTNPITRVVRFRGWSQKGNWGRLRLAAHEFVHVRQFGSKLWTRLWRLALYFASRRCRWEMEIEAKAHAIHAEWLVHGDTAMALRCAVDDARSLVDPVYPHLVCYDRLETTKAIRERFAEIAGA